MGTTKSDTWIYIAIIGGIGLILLLACYAGQYVPQAFTLVVSESTPPTGSPVPLSTTRQPSMTPASATTAPITVIPAVKDMDQLRMPADGLPKYDLDIILRAEEQRLLVEQHVLVQNASGDIWRELVFQLLPAHNPQNVTLHFAEVSFNAQNTVRSYAVQPYLEGIMLHIPLPAGLPSMEIVQATFAYDINIPDVDVHTWMPEGNLGAGEDVIQAGDWHAALVPYQSGQGWMTWNYTPVGDPFVYSLANYNVDITTSPEWVIAAPGFREQEGTTWHFQLAQARSFAFFASKKYATFEAVVENIPVTIYYVQGYEQAAKDVLVAASQSLWVYAELYGPYPMPELVIVQNGYYGSMEYSALISLSQHAFADYDGKADSQLISLTVHEIAHQWWYGAVGVDQVHEPWLDEGFAKYSEYIFYERYYPELTDWWWYVHANGDSTDGAIDRSIYAYSDASAYVQQLYPRAARFLADLREDMGDAAFFEFVQALRRFGEGNILTGDAFFALLENYDPPHLDELKARYFAYLD